MIQEPAAARAMPPRQNQQQGRSQPQRPPNQQQPQQQRRPRRAFPRRQSVTDRSLISNHRPPTANLRPPWHAVILMKAADLFANGRNRRGDWPTKQLVFSPV